MSHLHLPYRQNRPRHRRRPRHRQGHRQAPGRGRRQRRHRQPQAGEPAGHGRRAFLAAGQGRADRMPRRPPRSAGEPRPRNRIAARAGRYPGQQQRHQHRPGAVARRHRRDARQDGRDQRQGRAAPGPADGPQDDRAKERLDHQHRLDRRPRSRRPKACSTASPRPA